MINKLLIELSNISNVVWDEYVFRREVRTARLDRLKKASFSRKARDYAKKVALLFNGQSISEYVKHNNILVENIDTLPVGEYTVFALYTHPNLIQYNGGLISRLESQLDNNSKDILGNNSILDVVLLHEIFHYIEENDPVAETSLNISTFRIGTLNIKRPTDTLSEIAANEFVRIVLGMKCSPFALDVLLTYCVDEKIAQNIYLNIIALKNKECRI